MIGDTQQFSSISCCNTDKYDEITQNSSNIMPGASQFVVSVGGSLDDSVDEVLDGEDSCRLLRTSRTKLKMRFKLSIEMRSLR